MTTDLTRFTQWAAERPQRRYTALMGMLSEPDGLAESFHRQKAGKAPGVDGVKKADYEQGLEGRLPDLSARLRRMGFRPKPARRVYIPKSSGKGMRPLGLPSFEDRIVEDRLSRILQAIWEPEFRDCSYGFRPGRSAHQALARLEHIITVERTQWLCEVDVRNYFGSVTHEHMERFLAHRIGDSNLLRLIQRFLKAGVMEEGAISATDQGTPQGNLVSPVLSNIYLHYCLDVWFERRFARQCRGKAVLVRFAEPTKTALIRFGDLAPIFCKRDGLTRPSTFSFLGFTHYLRVWRNGRITLRRKTEAARVRRKLTELGRRLKSMRTDGARAMQRYTLQHWQGHLQYFGVRGNSRSLGSYVFHVTRLLFKWINRRSQRRSFNWERFYAWTSTWMPRPRIVHSL
jgi:RNA-directed DNA polymerase